MWCAPRNRAPWAWPGSSASPRIAHVLVAQPVGQHHHHAVGQRVDLARVDVQVAGPAHAGEQGPDGARLVLQHQLELRLQAPVLGQQVVEVAVQEAVAARSARTGCA